MRQRASLRPACITAGAVYKHNKANTILDFRRAEKFVAHAAARPPNNQTASPQDVLKLFALLAHQISQPLTILIGEIELALQLPISEKELRAALERCSCNLELTSRLVGDFRILSEMGPTLIGTTPLVALITQIVEVSTGSAESAGHKLKWRPPKEFYLETDSEVLQRAVSKMLATAVSDCLSGGTLEITLLKETKAARLSLSYPGRERAAKRKPPAPRIQAASFFPCAPGTSPELAIPKAMIEALGGSLRVQRQRGSAPRTRIEMTIGLVAALLAAPVGGADMVF